MISVGDEDDWLDIPSEDSEEEGPNEDDEANDWLNMQPPKEGDLVSPGATQGEETSPFELALNSTKPRDRMPAVPENCDLKTAEAVVRARRLKPAQRTFIRCLVQTANSVKEALRLYNARHQKQLSFAQVQQWPRNPDYKATLATAQEYYLEVSGIDPKGVLLKAVRVYESAMEPAPILHKGKSTGYYEQDRASAMRATEFLGKNVGIGNESNSNRVTVQIINLSKREAVVDAKVVDG